MTLAAMKMTDQTRKAEHFRALHIPGTPLLLFNIWDAGSAKAVAAAGAKAIATSSWSVANANGFSDGEQISLTLAIENLRRIVSDGPAGDNRFWKAVMVTHRKRSERPLLRRSTRGP